MAVASTTVWEVRTTGNTNNGGGFNSARGGTDFSQQDSAQYNFTDLASTNGTSSTPTVTSASHTFVTADLGNILHISAGTSWTTGWYEITSISGGGAVLDRACGSVASLTAGTFFVGGAITASSLAFGAPVAGNTIWFKAGNHSSTGITIQSGSTAAGFLVAEGYNTTRGDSPTGSSRPVLDFGNTASMVFNSYNYIKNLIMQGGNTQVVSGAASATYVINCKFINNSTTAGRIALNLAGASSYGGNTYVNCEFISYRGTGVSLTTAGGSAYFLGCYFHHCNKGYSGSGLVGCQVTIKNCIFENCVNTAIDAGSFSSGTAKHVIINNTIYGSESQIGIGLSLVGGTSGSDTIALFNNIFYGLATGVTSSNNQQISMSGVEHNCFYNNGTDRSFFAAASNDIAVNPQFANVTQISGFGSFSGSTMTVLSNTGKNITFDNVVDNQDYVYVSGNPSFLFLITSHTTNTITISGTPVAGIASFQITLGHNFAIGTNLKGLGYPGAFPVGLTTGSMDIGAVQRSPASYSGIVNYTGINSLFNGKTRLRY